MNFKKILIISFISILVTSASVKADNYPEMRMNPMYSALNPFNIDLEDDEQEEKDTLFGIFKRKKNENSDKSYKTSKRKGKNYYDYNDDDKFDRKQFLKEIEDEYKKELEEFEKEQEKDDKFVRPKKNSDLVKELEKEQREREKALQPQEEKVPLKERLKFWKKKDKNVIDHPVNDNPDIELSADYMQYYPERYEVEAVGNAKVSFKKFDLVLNANKITFNYDKNILKAKDNVNLISNDSVTEGDFIRLDLNKPLGFIENPKTKAEDIKLEAKEAHIYSNKIEQYDGVATIMKNDVMTFGTTSFAAYVDKGQILTKQMNKKEKQVDSGVYSLKAKTIYIDPKKDHDVITIKNADLYLKNKRIAIIPSAKIVTNKDHSNIETNAPEIGATSLLGTHIGPGIVLNVPGGSTLKLTPIATYSDDKLGFGGIARFRNEYNMTEVAYGTSREHLLIRGRHQIAPGLKLTYSKYTNQNEWFMGYRKPKYSAELNYTRHDYVKDLKLHFSQMYTAGAFVDYNPRTGDNYEFRDAEGRFRWMTQTYKPLFEYKNQEGNVSVNAGIVAQTAATAYTTGDIHGIFRVGPALTTSVGPWQQSLIYYQSAIAGQSPFEFDRYRYGRSNFVFIESLRICKYLSVGYLASISMNNDYSYDKTFQENRFLLSVGPDYAKVTLGYDAIRHNTMLMLSMMVGTKDSDIKYDKAVIKNVENLGKNSKKSSKPKKKNYKKYLKKDIREEIQEREEKARQQAEAAKKQLEEANQQAEDAKSIEEELQRQSELVDELQKQNQFVE